MNDKNEKSPQFVSNTLLHGCMNRFKLKGARHCMGILVNKLGIKLKRFFLKQKEKYFIYCKSAMAARALSVPRFLRLLFIDESIEEMYFVLRGHCARPRLFGGAQKVRPFTCHMTG